MLRLIILEMKKVNISKYLMVGVLTAIFLCGCIIFIPFYDNDHGMTAEIMMAVIKTLNTITFSFVTLFLFIEVVIGEYNKGTVRILYTYPINRKKIIAAKLLFIGLFNFILIAISNFIFIQAFDLLAANADNYIKGPDVSLLIKHVYSIPLEALTNTIILFLPFAIGFYKKSSKVTAYVGIILIVIMNQQSNGFSLNDIFVIPMILAIISLIFIYTFICKRINNEDI